ncbi:Os07g0524300, partial [Oryza sativa Japonica Group]
RRRRLERQRPGDPLQGEVRRREHLHGVHLHRRPHLRRRPRPDLPARHHRLPHRVAVVPHHRHHLAILERRAVRVVRRHGHVEGQVQRRRRDEGEGGDARADDRRRHPRRPRPEHGEVERGEDGGEDDGGGERRAAADQRGLPPGGHVPRRRIWRLIDVLIIFS